MTLTTALIGLIGVLGGAAIGVVGAIYGPSRLHNKQTEQKSAEEAAQRIESEIKRIVALRATGRAWLSALERVVDDIDAGIRIDLDRFDALIDPLSKETSQAAYGLSVGPVHMQRAKPAGVPRARSDRPGVPWVASEAPSPRTPTTRTELAPAAPESSPSPDELHSQSTDSARSNALVAIRAASDAVRNDVRRINAGDSASFQPRTRFLLGQAQSARASLNAELLAWIEEITGSSARLL